MRIVAVMALAMMVVIGCQVEHGGEVGEVKQFKRKPAPSSTNTPCPIYHEIEFEFADETQTAGFFELEWDDRWGHKVCLLEGAEKYTPNIVERGDDGSADCSTKTTIEFVEMRGTLRGPTREGHRKTAIYAKITRRSDGSVLHSQEYHFKCLAYVLDTSDPVVRWVVEAIDTIDNAHEPPGDAAEGHRRKKDGSSRNTVEYYNSCLQPSPSKCRKIKGLLEAYEH